MYIHIITVVNVCTVKVAIKWSWSVRLVYRIFDGTGMSMHSTIYGTGYDKFVTKFLCSGLTTRILITPGEPETIIHFWLAVVLPR